MFNLLTDSSFATFGAPLGSGEQGEMDKAGCEVICGAPTTLAVKGLMMMMMMMMMIMAFGEYANKHSVPYSYPSFCIVL